MGCIETKRQTILGMQDGDIEGKSRRDLLAFIGGNCYLSGGSGDGNASLVQMARVFTCFSDNQRMEDIMWLLPALCLARSVQSPPSIQASAPSLGEFFIGLNAYIRTVDDLMVI